MGKTPWSWGQLLWLKSALMPLESPVWKERGRKKKNPSAKLSDTLGLQLLERKVIAAVSKMLTVIFLRRSSSSVISWASASVSDWQGFHLQISFTAVLNNSGLAISCSRRGLSRAQGGRIPAWDSCGTHSVCLVALRCGMFWLARQAAEDREKFGTRHMLSMAQTLLSPNVAVCCKSSVRGWWHLHLKGSMRR